MKRRSYNMKVILIAAILVCLMDWHLTLACFATRIDTEETIDVSKIMQQSFGTAPRPSNGKELFELLLGVPYYPRQLLYLQIYRDVSTIASEAMAAAATF